MNTPDWAKWKYIPIVGIGDACALALNIDPNTVAYKQVTCYPDYKYEVTRSAFSDELLEKFHNLLTFFTKARYKNPIITQTSSRVDDVKLSEFAAWCLHVSDAIPPIPPELAALVGNQNQGQSEANKSGDVASSGTGGEVKFDGNSQSVVEQTESGVKEDTTIAALFDLVSPAALAKMFPTNKDEGKSLSDWKGYSERASRNGLIAARNGRAMFNPYLAGMWWLNKKKPPQWDLARINRTLANNLPPRNKDSKSLLVSD